MFAAEIRLKLSRACDDETLSNAVDRLVVALQRNGQVLSDEWPVAVRGREIGAFVSIPERSALAVPPNRWVRAARQQLRDLGLTVRPVRVLGTEPGATPVCHHARPRAYILYTDAYSMESPLRCATCFGAVPLYRIPHTSDCENYEDLIFWRRQYQRLDALWLNSGPAEETAYRELTRHDSALAREGRALCRGITARTGRPAYYYVMKHRGRSRVLEQARRCPACGGKWLLDRPWHRFFDFRCDKCRLLSQVAFEVR